MSAPQYVPRAKAEVVRSYSSPPRRPGSWIPARPGEIEGPGQPVGTQLGHQGPDQGYALHLARHFAGRLVLTEGESEVDALAGCVGVALKRASLFGRAPVIHDLRIALTLFGFLGEPSQELLAFRRPRFDEVANPHHYVEQRHLVDLVVDETLRLQPSQVDAAVRSDWRGLLVDVVAPADLSVPPLVAPESAVVEPELESVEPEPAAQEPQPVAVEPEPDPAPEPVVAVAEPEPEPVAVEPEPAPEVIDIPEPEPVASVEDLVAEAHDGRDEPTATDPVAADHTELGSEAEIRQMAIEAAARAHRQRSADESETPEAGDEPAPAGAAAGDPPAAPAKKKIKKVKKVKKVKRVKKKVKKVKTPKPGVPVSGSGGSSAPAARPAGKASPPLTEEEKQAASSADSMFGRGSDTRQDKKKSASEARRRLESDD